MPLSVVVGGQYGSEGKGKQVSQMVVRDPAHTAVVRCGGSNAGHTADGPRGRWLLRQLPSGAVDEACQLYIAAGMQLDLEVLRGEIADCEIDASRLTIDPSAVIIESSDAQAEADGGLYDRVGSTLSGTGAAAARKVLRDPGLRRAADVPELKDFLGPVSRRLNEDLDAGVHVIVEGTQGFGLSLHHGNWPWVTGRDTTAAGFLSEAGLAPTLVDDVVLVLRTYPIRVGGPSGPMADETTWEAVARAAGYPTALAEYTTVTGRLRRVGEFDWHLAAAAVRTNRPTALALHGLDYIDHGDLGVRHFDELGPRSRAFISTVELRLGVPVRYIFTGPDGAEFIDRGPDVACPPGTRSAKMRS